jgi:hypothetical protein
MAASLAQMSAGGGGVIDLFKDLGGTAFTNSGTKSLGAQSISYTLK